MYLTPTHIIEALGLIGVATAIFLESGVFFGFFLPGDTLLFSAGIFALQGFFPLVSVIVVCTIAAILGDSVGYWTGKKMGRALFEKNSSFFFNIKRIEQAEAFYKKHGALAIIMARFVPLVRTFAPIIAGVARMPYIKFLFNNVVGGLLWAASLPLLGYYFGSLIPNPDRFILPIVFLVIAASFAPILISLSKRFIFGKKRK